MKFGEGDLVSVRLDGESKRRASLPLNRRDVSKER